MILFCCILKSIELHTFKYSYTFYHTLEHTRISAADGPTAGIESALWLRKVASASRTVSDMCAGATAEPYVFLWLATAAWTMLHVKRKLL